MSAATSCAPCAFGAVSSQLLSFPIGIATAQVTVLPIIQTIANGSLSTSFQTTTILPPSTAGGVTASTTITFTDPSQITWATLGTTLTYPTTYVDYLGFQGAAATVGACAQTIAPSSLTLPANAPSASLVYPLDRSNALPQGLISYLNGPGGFPAQLGGNQLQTCAALPGALPPTASVTSVVAGVTSKTTITSSVVTDIPPPTTYTTTSTSTFIGSQTLPATQAVVLSTGLVFNTATANPILIADGISSSLTAPLAVTLPGGSTTVLGAATTSGVDIKSILSSISSSASVSKSGIYPNTTTDKATSRTPPTGATTTRASYTGMAVANTPHLVNSCAGVLVGLAAVLCL